MNHLAIYNCRNMLELLDGTGIRCPPITSYLDRLMDFVEGTFARRREAERARRGRRPARSAAAEPEPDAPARAIAAGLRRLCSAQSLRGMT